MATAVSNQNPAPVQRAEQEPRGVEESRTVSVAAKIAAIAIALISIVGIVMTLVFVAPISPIHAIVWSLTIGGVAALLIDILFTPLSRHQSVFVERHVEPIHVGYVERPAVVVVSTRRPRFFHRPSIVVPIHTTPVVVPGRRAEPRVQVRGGHSRVVPVHRAEPRVQVRGGHSRVVHGQSRVIHPGVRR